MNVDFGLVCLFAIQIGLVFLVYHAWKGIKAEISALEAHRRDNAAVAASVSAIDAKIDALNKRMGEVEAAPKAGKARMEELEESISKVNRAVTASDAKVVSLAARVSAYARTQSKEAMTRTGR
jgi:chromosome segregation ATPase